MVWWNVVWFNVVHFSVSSALPWHKMQVQFGKHNCKAKHIVQQQHQQLMLGPVLGDSCQSLAGLQALAEGP